MQDFVHDYGLYLLRPEIITLYDSDPLVPLTTDSPDTPAASFLSLQVTTAKSLQESAYRRTRSLLSNLSYLPSLGYNESDLGPLEEAGNSEKVGVSLFEQTVAKWDSDLKSVTDFESQVADRAVVAQNIASTLDLANLASHGESSSVSTSFDSLSTFGYYAMSVVNDTPTASKYTTASGVQSSAHKYTRFVDNGTEFVRKLIEIYGDKDLGDEYTSYSLMHTLMQESFIHFAFGSLNGTGYELNVVSRYGVERHRGTSLSDSWVYNLDPYQFGKVAGKKFFNASVPWDELGANFASDMNEMGAISSIKVVDLLMAKIVGLAAYRGSSLYDNTKTALDVFTEKIGLPVGIEGSRRSSGRAIDDFERSPTSSSAHKLFQITSERSSNKVMYFDRSRNPGLPGGYIHGYTELFGNTGTADAAASKLIDAIDFSMARHREIISFLASNIYTGDGYKNAADISRVILEAFADLIRKRDNNTPPGGNDHLYDDMGPAAPYLTALESAGTARSPNLSLKGQNQAYTSGQGDSVSTALYDTYSPVFDDFELLYFVSMGSESDAYHASDAAINGTRILMGKWSKAFEHFASGGEIDSPSEVDEDNFYNTPGLRSSYAGRYGDSSALANIETRGTAVMERIMIWSVDLARKIFASETEFVSNPGTAYIRSIYPNSNGTTSYSFKDVCLLLTTLACFLIKTLFEAPFAGIIGSDERVIVKYRDDAGESLSKIYSFVPVSYDDARLCLAFINGQLSSLKAGLQRMTTAGGGAADLLVDGKFNPIYTPCQSSSLSIRKAEFLARRKKAPFHSLRYDEMTRMRVYERDAIKSLYRTELMTYDDTRILFVGVPAGIQHVMGWNQRYVKVIIAKRDQTQSSAQFSPISYIFDMYASMSTSVCDALSCNPWSLSNETRYGNLHLQDAVSDVAIFNTSLESGRDYGNLSLSRAPSISIPNLTRRLAQGAASNKVQISDLIVTLEFVDRDAVIAETGNSAYPASINPVIAGSHLVDYLLKTHVRNISGLDFADSTFTTSKLAFNPNAPLDDTRDYTFNVCTVDFINMSRASDSLAFKTDVKMLDLLSRTPIIRSAAYADLCRQPTLFDRVFAVPVNLRMFAAAGAATS